MVNTILLRLGVQGIYKECHMAHMHVLAIVVWQVVVLCIKGALGCPYNSNLLLFAAFNLLQILVKPKNHLASYTELCR